MKSYLSIDLDYWMKHSRDTHSFNFINSVFSLGKKIRVVRSHEELLEHINESNADNLYNVDYHADIFGFFDAYEMKKWMRKNYPDEGTWGVFVKWRKNGTFCWMHPQKNYSIQGNGACWHLESTNPFTKGFHEWGTLKNRLGKSEIDFNSVTDVGICLSPLYSNINSVKRVVDKLGIKNNLENSKEKFAPFWFDPTKFNN